LESQPVKRLANEAKLQQLFDDLAGDHVKHLAKDDELNTKVKQLTELRDYMFYQLPELVTIDPHASIEEKEVQLEKGLQQSDEWSKRFEAYTRYLESDGLNEIQAERMRNAFYWKNDKRAGELFSMKKISRRVDLIRFGTEVVFPCVLALLAMLFSGLSLLRK
jgi:hypothetical protein